MKVDQPRTTYTIGQAAKMVQTTVKTLHHYDEIGLLRPSKRTEGGHRIYSSDDLWKLELIGTLRYVNFSLGDIRKIILGEIGMPKALNLQIEALEVEIGALSSMLSILKQARESQQQGDSQDSAPYLTELVASRSAHSAKRQQFVDHKVQEIGLLEQMPDEWKHSFLHFFNRYVLPTSKLTARQTQAWNEVQNLLNDPVYLEELANYELPFLHMALRPGLQADDWVHHMELIRIRAQEAVERQWSPKSAAVQKLTADFLLLYADVEQRKQPDVFIVKQARHLLDSTTERIVRFNQLCTIVNPEWRDIASGMDLLMRGMQVLVEDRQ